MKRCKISGNMILFTVAVLISGTVFTSIFYMYETNSVENQSIVAEAKDDTKDYKWTKTAVDSDVTIDAGCLWPNEKNASITGIYKNGKQISEDKSIIIREGGVYHFRGISDKSILYTEVYVNSVSGAFGMTGESGTWYKLLPSSIRSDFEENGWSWQTGLKYAGRVYLDKEHKRVIIRDNDPTAVLYGIGLYLDDAHNYSDDNAFSQEGLDFINKFNTSDNLFASALEYYYAKGGELRSVCPKIYAMVAEIVSELDAETTKIRNETAAQAVSEQSSEIKLSDNEPKLAKELLDYVNARRAEMGLNPVGWDAANDENILRRLAEIETLFSQTRPNGTDAFSAYTDTVMCEVRITDAESISALYDAAASYFLKNDLTAFNCAVHENIAILTFIW